MGRSQPTPPPPTHPHMTANRAGKTSATASEEIRTAQGDRPPIRRVDRLDEQKILALVAKYLHGSNVSEIAREFNVHETTVRAHLRRSGIDLRAYRKLSPDQIEEARQLRAAGASFAKLAGRYSAAGSTVRRLVGVTERS